jgi:hypothetical protein
MGLKIMENSKMTVAESAPSHLKSLVTPWLNWSPNPLNARSEDFAEWGVEVLSEKPLPFRQATQNAVAQWYREYAGMADNLISVNPYPYALLTRYAEYNFDDLWAEISKMSVDERGWHVVLLLGYCPKEVVLKRLWTIEGNFLKLENRSVPVTSEVSKWLQMVKEKPPNTWKPRWTVGCLQAALFQKVCELGVDERTRAGIWGRWSAMKFQKACRFWIFCTPIESTLD